MPTTIITDSEPFEFHQYGLITPNGAEHWAPGRLTISAEGEAALWTENNMSYTLGEFCKITSGSVFNGHDLDTLSRPAPTNKYDYYHQRKKTAVEQFYKIIDEVAASCGIDWGEYSGNIRIVRRVVRVMVDEDYETLPIPPRDWAAQAEAKHEEVEARKREDQARAQAETAAYVNGTTGEDGPE